MVYRFMDLPRLMFHKAGQMDASHVTESQSRGHLNDVPVAGTPAVRQEVGNKVVRMIYS